MRVLYVSKALVTGAYRDKLRALAAHCDVSAVMPSAWNGAVVDPIGEGESVVSAEAVLHGHNHLHVYRDPGAFIDRVQPDLVHIDEEPYSAVTTQVARHCQKRGIPCCFFAWQNIHKRIPPPFGIMRRYVFRTARGGIAGTDAAGRVLRAWGWRGPLAIIPQFGVDTAQFRPDPEARSRMRRRLGFADEFVVGFGGRLVTEKGVHVLLRAASELEAVTLLLAGDGPERERLAEAARARGCGRRMHFAGGVPSREMPEWLNAMDVLVLPSLTGRTWKEQFGRILVEAMACGVPVIGSDSGEIPMVIGDAGIIVAEDNSAALAEAIDRLAGHPELRDDLTRRGLARVAERYTQAHVAHRTSAFYRSLMEAA